MMRVVVASKNPIKIEAVKNAFGEMFSEDKSFEFKGVSIPSGVADQPMTDSETRQGALNRVEGARRTVPEADFWVGLEGGLEERDGNLEAFGWMAVASLGNVSSSRTATFVLPPAVSKLIHEGMELGEADDIVFNKSNSKQQNGAVGLLTGDHITRESYYRHALIMALIPFRSSDLYKE